MRHHLLRHLWQSDLGTRIGDAGAYIFGMVHHRRISPSVVGSRRRLGVLACVLSRLPGAAGSSAQSVVACPSSVLRIARVGAGPVCGGGADGLLLLGPQAAGSP